MKINISDISKDILLAGLYKFATIQGIGYVEQAALGSMGKPFLLIKETSILNEHKKKETGKLYFTSLFGKNLFVDISADEVDFTAYDFHNGSGLGMFVVDVARKNPSFFSEPISYLNAKLQLYCAINAFYQEIPIEEFNTLVTKGKIDDLINNLYNKYNKIINNHIGYPLTVVSTNQDYKVVDANGYHSLTPHGKKESMGCFYKEIAVEEMPAGSALSKCEKQLNDAIAFLQISPIGVFSKPLVRRDTRLLPIENEDKYSLFFSSYQLFPFAKVPTTIPTRFNPDPSHNKLSPNSTQKMLHELGLKPTALVGDSLVFTKGLSGKDIENLFAEVSPPGHTARNAFYERWKTSDPNQALRRAAFEHGPDEIEMILKKNEANINSQDNNSNKKYTALHIALYENKIDNALCLLKEGAEFKIKDAKGQTALDYAIKKSILPILTSISKQIMRFYDVDDMGKAFRMAANSGNISYLKVFIKLGVDVNGVGPSKKTALHYAAQSGKEESVTFLLQHDADINLVDINTKTALDCAKKPRIIELLNRHIKSDLTMTNFNQF